MKTRIVVEEHTVTPGAVVLELWYGSRMIGTVVGADGPGVRVISKYPREAIVESVLVTEIRLATGEG